MTDARALIKTIVRQWGAAHSCKSSLPDDLIAALRAEFMEEAAVIAYNEGERLYDDTGATAAHAAWGVAALLRREIKPVECPPGTHSLFDFCPGDCTLPVTDD